MIEIDSEIILYTTEVCPKCKKLKTFLQEKGIPFKTLDMQSPEGLAELRFNGCFALEAPVLQIGQNIHVARRLFKDGKDLSEETKFFLTTEAERFIEGYRG